MTQSVEINIRKVKNNILLRRKQFIIDVNHKDKPNIPKKELQKSLPKYLILLTNQLFLYSDSKQDLEV